MTATVSIIVPCYNVASYVDACMDSLVNQTLEDIEIICVNDGSTDDTPALLHAWGARDSRVRVIDRENGGLSVARNTGMDVAQGEYIGFVDPDDYVEHSMYERLLEEARSHDADVAVCGYSGFSDSDGAVVEGWSLSPDFGVEKDVQASFFGRESVWNRLPIAVWNKLYRKDLLERNRLRFEPSFRDAEDVSFWLMLMVHVSSLVVIPDRLYWYRRQRKGSLSLEWEDEGAPFHLLMERLMYAADYWKKCGWLESGLKRGWVFYAFRHFLLIRLMSARKPLPSLNREEWASLHKKFQEWFSLTEGKMDSIGMLDKWDSAFCLVLSRPVRNSGCLCRVWWKLLSHCRGRRGRYYEVCWKLSLSADKNFP